MSQMKAKRKASLEIPWYNMRYLFTSEDAVRYNPLWARVNRRGVKLASRRGREISPLLQECDDTDDVMDQCYDEEVVEVALQSGPSHQWTTSVMEPMKGGHSSQQSESEDYHSWPRRAVYPSMRSSVPLYKETDQMFSSDSQCLDDHNEESYNVPCLCPKDTDSCSSTASQSSCSAQTLCRTSDLLLPNRVYAYVDDRKRRTSVKRDQSSKEVICDSNVCDIVCEKLQTLEKNIQQFIATHEADIPIVSRNVDESVNKNAGPSIKIRVADCSQSDNYEVNCSEATSTASIGDGSSEDWLAFPKEARVVSISPLVVKYGKVVFGPEDIDIKVFSGDTFFKPVNNSSKVLNLKRVSINENSISKLMTLHESQLKGVCGWSPGRDSRKIRIEGISLPVSSVVNLAENGSDEDLRLYHKAVSSIVSLRSSENSSEFVDMLQAPKLRANPFKPNSTTNGGIFSAISVDLRAREYQQRKLSETSFKTIEGLECAAKMLSNFRSFTDDSSPAAFEAFSKRMSDFLTALAHQQTPILAHHLSKVFTIRKIMRSELTSEAKPVQMVSQLMSAPLVGKELFPKKIIAKVLKSHARPSADSENDFRDRPEVLFDFPLETLDEEAT